MINKVKILRDSGRIGSVPLILIIVLWTFLEGFGGLNRLLQI